MLNVNDIKKEFIRLYKNNNICENGTIEILNAQFNADNPIIFGALNVNYAERELEWYRSQSLNVNDMPGQVPKIWKSICSPTGEINSNYGWCIFSKENHNQFNNAIDVLEKDKYSRQATMIYNRPTMHADASRDGMRDFMCTFSVQLFIRNNQLHYTVYMRSNDAVFGYKNDKYWHDYVFALAYKSLKQTHKNLTMGQMIWHATSLHVYPSHFYLIGESIES